MWNAFMNKSVEDELLKAHKSDFAEHYLCKVMNKSSWDVNNTLATYDFKPWRRVQKLHSYVQFMFEATESGA